MEIPEELKTQLESEGYTHLRYIENRGICGLHNFIFTTGLLWGLDSTGYRGRWCYSLPLLVMSAIQVWDGIGDPIGPWTKYKGEGGERTNPQLK